LNKDNTYNIDSLHAYLSIMIGLYSSEELCGLRGFRLQRGRGEDARKCFDQIPDWYQTDNQRNSGMNPEYPNE
jgi:hypothetical protein